MATSQEKEIWLILPESFWMKMRDSGKLITIQGGEYFDIEGWKLTGLDQGGELSPMLIRQWKHSIAPKNLEAHVPLANSEKAALKAKDTVYTKFCKAVHLFSG